MNGENCFTLNSITSAEIFYVLKKEREKNRTERESQNRAENGTLFVFRFISINKASGMRLMKSQTG